MAAVFGILMTVAAAVAAIGIVLFLERGYNTWRDQNSAEYKEETEPYG